MMSNKRHKSKRHGIWLCGGILTMLLVSGCERFRHETYTCPSNSIGLHELIINDDKAGADLTVIEYDKEYTIPIGSITSDQMMASHQDMILILNRQTGRLNITMGNRALFLACEKSVFTM